MTDEMMDADLDSAVRKAMDRIMPAYPSGNPEQGGHSGMSLRDWLAGQALSGVCSANIEVDKGMSAPDAAKVVARSCYDLADAMLEARK